MAASNPNYQQFNYANSSRSVSSMAGTNSEHGSRRSKPHRSHKHQHSNGDDGVQKVKIQMNVEITSDGPHDGLVLINQIAGGERLANGRRTPVQIITQPQLMHNGAFQNGAPLALDYKADTEYQTTNGHDHKHGHHRHHKHHSHRHGGAGSVR